MQKISEVTSENNSSADTDNESNNKLDHKTNNKSDNETNNNSATAKEDNQSKGDEAQDKSRPTVRAYREPLNLDVWRRSNPSKLNKKTKKTPKKFK